jgi:hypothetical protein
MRTLGSKFESLREAIARDTRESPAEVTLGWQVDPGAQPTTELLLGVRSASELSAVSGTPQVRWTGETIEVEIPFIAMDLPTVTVRRPAAYYLPAAWYPIAEKLRAHGIEVTRLDSASTVEVEFYRLPDAALDAAHSPFEGRTLFTSGEPVVERRETRLPAGSFRVDTSQPLGTLAVLLLEPQCPDSLFQWGYFSEVLTRTEYFESYVMEPMAREMLAADPDLRAAFEARLLADAEFAGSASARLEWFYEKTPFYDETYRLYPVSRSLD